MKRWLFGFVAVFLLAGLIYLEPSLEVVNAQEQTTTFSDDFSRDTGSWQYIGAAYRDTTNKTLILTTSAYHTGGIAFFETPIRGSFTTSFRYKVGGGSHQGDGFAMFFYKQKFTTPDEGGSLGFSSLEGSVHKIVPGYGIEFDGWRNPAGDSAGINGEINPQGDPSDHHVALIKDFSGDHLTWVDDQRIADNIWHQVTINVQPTTIQVYIDGDLVLEWSGTFDRTYDGFGFSGGTGGPGSNWHIIDDVSITAKELHTPTLTTTCISSVGTACFPIQINGQLTFNNVGIQNAPIQLSDSVTGGESWQDLTLVHTGEDGKYSAVWLLSVTGDYMLKATYKGNNDYLGTSNIVNFSVAPCTDQSVFSVTSNSTLSQLTFNSENKEMSFSVSGASGSTGYINIYIPNTLTSDISALKLYLDGNPLSYTTQSLSDGWLLYATYHHSSHHVTIALGTQTDNHQTPTSTQPNQTASASTPLDSNLDLVQIAILVLMGIIAAMSVIVAVRFLTRKDPEAKQ